MGSDSELPVGYRFDPTKEELLLYLQPKPNGLNGKKFARIPPIKMGQHHPKRFAELGALMGKDGMYILANWDKKDAKGKRKNRQVKTDSETGQWKLQGSEPIRSSDGEQIGTKKNYDFKVPDSLVEWHMEEYLLYPEKSSQDSICRVFKKCIQGRRRTKIDAEVDNVDHLFPEANNTKGKKEAAQCCISDTGNDIDIAEMVDNLFTTNSVYSLDDNFHNGPNPAEHYVDNLVTTNSVYSLDDNFHNGPNPTEHYVDNLVTTNSVYSLDDNFHNVPNPAEHYVDNLNTRNCQSPNHTVLLDWPTRKYIRLVENVPMDEEDVDNLYTGNCQSANDTVLGMNATEMVDNLDTGNCPSPMDMDAIDDVTKAGNCVSSPGQTIFYKDLEDTCQLLNQPRSIYGANSFFRV